MPLSDGEQKLLLFGEQDPESPTDPPDELLEGIDYEFEKRITSLLKAAYERDRNNPNEREKYTDAMQKLKGTNHYILVMAEPALAPTRAPDRVHSQTNRARDIAIYIGIGLALVAAAVAIAVWIG